MSKDILKSGMVKKYKYYFFYDTRQLVLNSDHVLEYWDPFRGKLKGKIYITDETKVLVYGDNYLYLTSKGRTFVFKCLEHDA